MGDKAGFTGTRHGMTGAQRERLERLLLQMRAGELHHGDCRGADERAHRIASNWAIRTVGHPPLSGRLRAWCECDELREPKEYLERNRDIVDETDYLVATPQTAAEVTRSGTWATVRYARSQHKPVYLILPDGTLGDG